MAVLADTQAKRDLHVRDLHLARASGTAFHVAELLPLNDYHPPERWGVFYGESLSILQFFLSRGTPHDFVMFLDSAKLSDYNGNQIGF